MKVNITSDDCRYCTYSDIGSVPGNGNFWNKEFLTALVILFRRHNVGHGKDPAYLDPDSFEEKLKEEKVIDKDILDLAGIEKICPVRFRRKVHFEQKFIIELVKGSHLCILEVQDAADGTIHYFACDGFTEDDVLIIDPAGTVSELGKKGTCRKILWFYNLDRINENAPRDAIAVVMKAVSFLGTTDTPLHSRKVIFNYDFREGEPIREDDAWCTAFVWDVFRMCGLSHLLCDGAKTQDAIDVLEWGKKRGLLVGLEDIRYGDLLVFNWDQTGSADHTAICITTTPDNAVITVDGCTGELDDTIGGHVNLRCRTIEAEEILGVIRPEYK